MVESPQPSPDEAIVDVLAWICLQDNCVLGTRTRGNDVYYLPGGKREPGESDWNALFREVQEELGVALIRETLTEMLTVEEAAYGYSAPTRVHMKCFHADYAGKLQPMSEIAAIAWLSYADLAQCAPACQRVIEHLHKHQLIA